MKMTDVKPVLLAVLILGVAACDKPMDRSYTVDGTRNRNFNADLVQCKEVARAYRSPNANGARVAGGLVGAAAGAVEAEDGDKLEAAAAGAALGALIGHLEAQSDLSKEQRNVVIRCLQNRGHNVVG